MPITATELLSFGDMACSLTLLPRPVSLNWRGWSTAGPSHYRTIRAQICCAAQLTFYCARLRSSAQGGLGETAITSAVDRPYHPHTNGRMAMKTFLLSTILATAFTFIVSVAAAGPCVDGN